LVVISEGAEASSKIKFDVLVDGVKMGDLSNGGTSTYMITPGHHCVKIGRASIWIDVPEGSSPVTLDWHWNKSVKSEIICKQDHLVTKPSELEKTPVIVIAGRLCAALGAIGFILGFILLPSHSGGGMTAVQHVAFSNAVDFASSFIVGGVALAVIGVITLILSSPKEKK
jgi:hypothetical protein